MPEQLMSLETILSVCLGLGLAAACGFRIFVPLLVMSVASMSGYLELTGKFEWIGTMPALVTLIIATVLEIGAYYVPWLDNLLDTVASPVAVVAGVLVSASVITGMDPYLKWTLAVIAGGGVAGSVQMLTAGSRGLSTLTTAGFGNPVVSTVEAGGSLVTAVLAVVAPLLAIVLVGVLLISIWTRRGSGGAVSGPGDSAGDG